MTIPAEAREVGGKGGRRGRGGRRRRTFGHGDWVGAIRSRAFAEFDFDTYGAGFLVIDQLFSDDRFQLCDLVAQSL